MICTVKMAINGLRSSLPATFKSPFAIVNRFTQKLTRESCGPRTVLTNSKESNWQQVAYSRQKEHHKHLLRQIQSHQLAIDSMFYKINLLMKMKLNFLTEKVKHRKG